MGDPLPDAGPHGEELIGLALSRPVDAERRARALLGRRHDPLTASYAHHALGIVLRDGGHTGAAIRAFRASVRAAAVAGDAARGHDALASLGTALNLSGRNREALAALDAAAAGARGVARARIRVRRAVVRWSVGQNAAAITDLTDAIRTLTRSRDVVWEARARLNRAMVHVTTGRADATERDLVRAEALFAAAGQDLEHALVRHTRGLVAAARGDLPDALARLHEAREVYRTIGATVFDLAVDLCHTLLDAGLAREASDLMEHELTVASTRRGNAAWRAEMMVAAARADIATGRLERGRANADEAARLLRRQRRAAWADRAEALALRATASGDPTPRMLARARRLAVRLGDAHAPEAVEAHLTAATLALTLRRPAIAADEFARAASGRRRAAPLPQSLGWLAAAHHRILVGRTASAMDACDRGLRAVEEHLFTLGAEELRAYATTHGTALATLAVRELLRTDDAMGALAWIERWRSIATAAVVPAPIDDPALLRDMTALRRVASLIDAATAARERVPVALMRDRARLERAVRDRSRTRAGGTPPERATDDLAAVVEALGERALVEIAVIDDELVAIVLAGGDATAHTIGPVGPAVDEAARALFTVRGAAARRASAAGAALLEAAGTALADRVLGPDVTARIGDQPTLIVPPAALAGVPWGMIPALADRPTTVAHSAAAWRDAHVRRPTAAPAAEVTLVTGPGLRSGGREVEALHADHPQATCLTGDGATVDAVLAALDGAPLGHVAAHGTFRADAPLFSSLRLADGPLTAHDLRRLRRAPHRLVLSSCDSGAGSAAGSDGVLGFAAALLGMGTAGLVAALTAVDDEATVPFALALHERLLAEDDLDAAVVAGRAALDEDDPVARATGAAFVAYGA